MTVGARLAVPVLLLAAATATLPARAADDDADALSLQSAPVESAASAPTARRFYVEGALGTAEKREGGGSDTLRRATLDYYQSFRLAPAWQAVLSDRLDYQAPVIVGEDYTINSLREAYVGWQQENGATAADLGRINLRQGPAYGYNPTDFFRANSLRTITTVNPLALRENRMGTVALRGQGLWNWGSVSLALAPKLGDGPSPHGESLDIGATNDLNRGLLVVGARLGQHANGQLLVFKEDGSSAALGLNGTAVLSDAVVGYGEWTHSHEVDLLGRAFGLPERKRTGDRFAGGLTWTSATKLSLTVEYQYNRFALDRDGFENLATAGPAAVDTYLREAVRRQDLPSRYAFLIYARQQSAFVNNLDITGFVNLGPDDHSWLGWLELRYHWSRLALALQLTQQGGNTASVYGTGTYKRSAQVLLAYDL